MTKFKSSREEFDQNYLNRLISDVNSGIFVRECKYHIALHPAQIKDVRKSIKDELARKTAHYDEVFNGIMLGYQSINLPSQLGNIGLDNTFIHFDIQAKFFVFRPTAGMVLKGTVTRTTEDHVGCLVYKKFNISLPKPKNDDPWLGQKAKVNNEVEFKITYVDLSARLPHIRGDIRNILNLNRETLETSVKSSKNQKQTFHLNKVKTSPKKKSKKKDKEDAVGHNGEVIKSGIPEVREETPSKKKGKKANKSIGNDDEITPIFPEVPDESYHKHTKKRSKQSIPMDHANEFQPQIHKKAKLLAKEERKKLKKEKMLGSNKISTSC